MNLVLAPAEGANFKTVKSHISPRTYHFVGVRSLVALASVACLAVMSATAQAQTATTAHFVLKITTTAGTNPANKSFTFYTEDTNYDIDWDNDGVFEDTNVSGSQSHTFTTVGEYTIRFRNLNDVHINNQAGREKYTSIEQWGTAVWDADMSFAFQGASRLTMTATDTPNMSAVTNMRSMFYGATSFNGDLSEWNTASVTNMYRMFSEATKFNGDISGWNTESVTNMHGMFQDATSFDQNIGGWNTAKVTNMKAMFLVATSFNQDIGGWNVEAVTTMQRMFYGVTLSFKNYDSLLVGWNRQNLRPSVVFGGGNSSYMSTQAQTARENMTTSDRWSITDGGLRTMNQAPANIFLSANSIAENAGVNAVVGMLSNTDTGGTYTYTLVDGDGDADNGSFNILGTTLRLTASADYETLAIIPPQTTRSRANYSVRINVSDGTHDFAKEFTVSIDDVNEAPTARDDAFSVAESSANGTPVGTVLATDPDPVQNPSYTPPVRMSIVH